MSVDQITGHCLCGGVSYRASGPIRDVVNCHCGQCRRTHGHFVAYCKVSKDGFELVEERSLKWYRASDLARRGFCSECGASLFWEGDASGQIGIAAGTLDEPTGLKTIRHIFCEDKGDYYEITDGLEQLPRGHDG
ncbi:MAG: GFA family protein [Rhodospirillaceae bacterium]|nr:GFA family protein [Rhodospirillaceae bacterium]